jgi:hypothetical protein
MTEKVPMAKASSRHPAIVEEGVHVVHRALVFEANAAHPVEVAHFTEVARSSAPPEDDPVVGVQGECRIVTQI